MLTEKPDAKGEAGDITWNFEKFLVDADGSVVGRFRPQVDPHDDDARRRYQCRPRELTNLRADWRRPGVYGAADTDEDLSARYETGLRTGARPQLHRRVLGGDGEREQRLVAVVLHGHDGGLHHLGRGPGLHHQLLGPDEHHGVRGVAVPWLVGGQDAQRARHTDRVDPRGEQVGVAEELRQLRVDRPLVDLGGRADLGDLPGAQHGDLVGHRQRLVLVVGDEHGGGPAALAGCG